MASQLSGQLSGLSGRFSEADFFIRNVDILCCPGCGAALEMKADGFGCRECASSYPIVDGIPRFFASNAWDASKEDVTEEMKGFYEETPFPNYDDFDSTASLVAKARQGVFAKLLDEQLPFGTRLLEAGCGTGQLTNFLAVANRTVFGTDICLNSLTLARDFKEKNQLRRAHFLQMNLFRPCFKGNVFDLVISNGVLHHTSDPYLAFKTLAALVRPGGYLIVGLYHRYGRLATDLRRTLFRMSHDRFKSLDPRNVRAELSEGKRTAWFRDQYKNPHESKHTIAEVLGWLDSIGLEFVKSIPKAALFESFQMDEKLFRKDRVAKPFETAVKELSMALWRSQIREGGFFVMIARKPRHEHGETHGAD